jgi:hypothetical protein
MASHAAYGIVTTFVAAKLGESSLYDTEPQNDYIEPTYTTDQSKNNREVELKYRRKRDSGLNPASDTARL